MKSIVSKKAACLAVLFVLVLALLPALAAPAAAAAAETETELPAVFDLRNVDTDGDGIGDACWVTPVKNQDPHGTCWGFAAIASAETSILSSGLAAQDGYAAYADPENGLKELDLSEKQVAYFALKPLDDLEDPQYGEGLRFLGEEGSSGVYSTGGMPFFATGLFASGVGPAHESIDEQLEYHGKDKAIVNVDGAPYCYSAKDDWNIDDELRYCQSYVLKESYILQSPAGLSGEAWETAVRDIKEVLYTGHAVNICIYGDMDFWDGNRPRYFSENWSLFTFEAQQPDHVVTIIGWDDRYPRENFAHKTAEREDTPLPEHNGAWLVKNSWGSEEREFPNWCPWGLLQGQDVGVYNAATGKYEYNAIEGALHTGYFWVSYDDLSLSNVETLEFDAVTAEEGYYVAEHDYMPVWQMTNLSRDSEISEANVFCVGDDVDAARLEMISCQTVERNVDLHVDVYLLDEDWETPTDGTLVSQADTRQRYGGFHKVVLDTPVLLMRDRYFSVVVTQRYGEGKYLFNFQICVNRDFADAYGYKAYCVSVINPRESFYGSPGNWKDLSDPFDFDVMEEMFGPGAGYYEMDNFPIKAYLAIPSEADVPRAAEDYTDLKEDAYYYGAASWLLDGDIAMGTSPDSFSPNEPCSRGQVVTWLWRAAGMPEPETKESPFRDVNKGDYFYKAALWAAENGVIDGVAEGEFAPGRAVTRAHMAAILYRYEKLSGGGFAGDWAFPLGYADAAEIPEYAHEPFCWLTMNGVFEGDGVNLNPTKPCTRAHAACVLQRYFGSEP